MSLLVMFGDHDEGTIRQITSCQTPEADAPAVLCADGHLGYSMPIGGVIGYERHISPSAIGYDIACGNLAVKTDAKAADINAKAVMDEIWKTIAFGMGRKNNEPAGHAVLEEIAECHLPVQKALASTAASQFGTVGSGNHYVDLFADETGWLWIGVHFGSRGFGHKTATWALEQIGATNQDMHAPPAVIPLGTDLADAYVDGMLRAGRYAYAGREWVVSRVLRILQAGVTKTVHNHHNFAWLENHGGRALWVHRKGATPAFPGQQGFVGATMGEDAVILEGVESLMSQRALYSTVHGAGRAMSRTKAAGKTKQKRQWKCQDYRNCNFTAMLAAYGAHLMPGSPAPACPVCGGRLRRQTVETVVTKGLIDFAEVQSAMDTMGIELRGAGADEAPLAYKRLQDVLAHHVGTVKVLHRLRPIGVAMAGKDVEDPYKD